MRKFLIPAIAILVLTGCDRMKNRILIRNDSADTCPSITVAVCDSTWTTENLAPGEQQEFTIVYSRDDHFQVIVERNDGQTLEGHFGYVTHGVTGDQITIVFAGDSILFSQSLNSSY